jgi:hypothetical protein
MERPPLSLDRGTRLAIDEFLSLGQPENPLDVNAILRAAGNVTPWQFLCGLADRREIAFHGTGDPNIESFEPREPIDFAPFGQQKAVFATSDPIWAMFYAIVDRDRYQLTLNNGCILVMDGDAPDASYYYFSITGSALDGRPWRTGYVYFLPPESFVEQPAGTYAGHAARIPQLASPVAVRPFARLQVAPDDFPFLAQIRGHEDDRLAEYAQAVMAAAPWPD